VALAALELTVEVALEGREVRELSHRVAEAPHLELLLQLADASTRVGELFL
jgi:hypothetical protein